jgi:hypothetical protein
MNFEMISVEILLNIFKYLPNWIKMCKLSKYYTNVVQNNKNYISFIILQNYNYKCNLRDAYNVYKCIQRNNYKDCLFVKAPKCRQAFKTASQNGHVEVVKLLLLDPRINPAVNNEAFLFATWYGHTEIVRLLLQDPRVDPSARNNYAAQVAVEKNYTEIIRLLSCDTRVKMVF